jgi:hypothetical protein
MTRKRRQVCQSPNFYQSSAVASNANPNVKFKKYPTKIKMGAEIMSQRSSRR